jgi:hypothetical protein
MLQNESGGNYQATNSQGFFGGYQFGCAAAQDVGLVKQGTFDRNLSTEANNRKCDVDSNWTIPGGKQTFMTSPQLQDQAFDRYANQNVSVLKRAGVINNNTPEGDIGGYVAASHIGGAGGAIALSKGEIRADANGTTTQKYFADGKSAVNSAQGFPQNSSVTDADREEALTINTNGGDVTAEQVSQNRQLNENLTSQFGLENPPTGGSLSTSISSGDAPIQDLYGYSAGQYATADKYGTQVGSQQSLILSEQDSWFAEEGGAGVNGGTGSFVDNPLTAFSSFNYIFTLGCIPYGTLESPSGYGEIILQSANGRPTERVETSSGKWDFYINEAEIESLVGYSRVSKGTNVTSIKFEVVEPYSMGLFLQSCQIAAKNSGHPNYAEAPFMLTVEFVGWDDDGKPYPVPDSTRRIAMHFTNMDMDISTKGCRYKVEAIPWAEYGLTDEFNRFQSDVDFSPNQKGGFTVEDILVNAESSLQEVVNKRFKDRAKKQQPSPTPDKIKIEFADGADDIRSSEMGFDLQTGGSSGIIKENEIWENDVFSRKKLTYEPKNKRFVFKQGTTVVNAITEVLLLSEYCKNNIKSKVTNPSGMIDWFRIETKVRSTDGDVNKANGRPAREVTFVIVSYKTHSSRVTHPSAKPDYGSLKSNVVKSYDYIYTGKNTEIIDFNINLKYGFFTTAFADLEKANASTLYAPQYGQGKAEDNPNPIANNPLSGEQETEVGQGQPTVGAMTTRDVTEAGGPLEDYKSLVAKTFHEKLLNTTIEMVSAQMEILGDPYYVISSGTANNTESKPGATNITDTGAMDYQNGEVDILLNFRTPTDINPETGLADFSSTEAAKGFSGLYQVVSVINKFGQGKFTQTLDMIRRPRQFEGGSGPEFKEAPKAEQHKVDGTE